MSKTGRGVALADVLPPVIAVPVVMSDCVPVGEGVEVRVGLPKRNQLQNAVIKGPCDLLNIVTECCLVCIFKFQLEIGDKAG